MSNNPWAVVSQTPAQQSSTAPTNNDPWAVVSQTPAGQSTDQSTDQSQAQTQTDALSATNALNKTITDLGTGVIKGLGDTTSGVAHLINKIPVVGETLSPKQGITALDTADVSNGAAELAGKGIENIGEFALGDEAMKGAFEGLSHASQLVNLAKKYPQIAEVLNMADSHPWLAKIITSSLKGGTVGGAQGALKGASQGEAGEQGKAGAVGGAVGGPAGEALAEAPQALAKLLGVGGQSYAEAMTKALRPSVKEGDRFAKALVTAKPVIADIPKNEIKTVGDFEDAIYDRANQLWNNTVAPRVARITGKPGAFINGDDVAKAINQTVDEHVGMRDLYPSQVAPIDTMAKHFQDSTKIAVDKAEGYLKTINAQLKGFYAMSPVERAAAGVTNGRIVADEAAADAIRDQLYSKIDQLENLPAGTAQKERQLYGALKDIERVSGKRATVTDRQNPLSLQQIMGMMEAAGAVLSGHPAAAAAGAVPWALRGRQSAESLTRQGIGAAGRELGQRGAVRAAAKEVAKGLTPALASGMVRVLDSAGGVHDLPQDSLGMAQQKDPGLEVVDQNGAQ